MDRVAAKGPRAARHSKRFTRVMQAGRGTGSGHEASFALTVAQTFRRRFHSAIGHSICSGEVVLVLAFVQRLPRLAIATAREGFLRACAAGCQIDDGSNLKATHLPRQGRLQSDFDASVSVEIHLCGDGNFGNVAQRFFQSREPTTLIGKACRGTQGLKPFHPIRKGQRAVGNIR